MNRGVPLLVALVFALAGCSSYDEYGPGYEEHLEGQGSYQESEEYLEAEGDYYAEQQQQEFYASQGWQCFWDPTMNDDWHDDYLCSNGSSYDRPYLLPNDSFIEQWEIDAAASEYEAALNG